MEAHKSNFQLKTDVFQREIDRTKLENKKLQAEHNIRLLTDKKKKLDGQLTQAKKTEELQTRKVEEELTKVNNSLARAKQDCEASEVRLQDL